MLETEHIRFHLLATGRPYTDLIADVSDDWLHDFTLQKGDSYSVSAHQLLSVIAKLRDYKVRAGGSPPNTCAVVQALGGRAAFVGKTCNDEAGQVFRAAFDEAGVFFPTSAFSENQMDAITGTCVIVKTPDAMETMIHCPGVGDVLGTRDFPADLITSAKVFYIQSHLLFAAESRNAVMEAIKLARSAGGQIAFSLHDHQMGIHQTRVFFTSFVQAADIVIGNRKEVEEVVGQVRGHCLLVMTEGPDGAHIWHRNVGIHIAAPANCKIENTIGAGDAFAAGFLYGYALGLPLDQAGELGARAAGRIMTLTGGRPEGSWLDLIV